MTSYDTFNIDERLKNTLIKNNIHIPTYNVLEDDNAIQIEETSYVNDDLIPVIEYKITVNKESLHRHQMEWKQVFNQHYEKILSGPKTCGSILLDLYTRNGIANKFMKWLHESFKELQKEALEDDNLIQCKKDPIHFIKTLSSLAQQDEKVIRDIHQNKVSNIKYEDHVEIKHVEIYYALYYAIFNVDSIIGIFSSSPARNETLRTLFISLYNNLPEYCKPKMLQYNKSFIEFEGGCQVIFCNYNVAHIKGRSLSLCILDNFDEAKNPKIFMESVYPCLTKLGKIILT